MGILFSGIMWQRGATNGVSLRIYRDPELMRDLQAEWMAAMRAGDYATAWAVNEAVLAVRNPATRDDPGLPYHLRWVWDGRPFRGRDVLVRCYHGLGDTLQFARYLPVLRQQVASLTVEVQPALLPLLGRVFGGGSLQGGPLGSPAAGSSSWPGIGSLCDPIRPSVQGRCRSSLRHGPGVDGRVKPGHDGNGAARGCGGGVSGEREMSDEAEVSGAVARVPVRVVPFVLDRPLPPAACDIEIMELPHALRLPPEGVPPLDIGIATEATQQVGLCWMSGGWDTTRDVPAELMSGLAHGRVSLQPFPVALPVCNPGGCSLNVAETARLIARLRLVITVDTMVAHLAGTLGRPTWLLLKHDADWRWMRGRADSPWYPSMRLFRQPEPGNWAAVMAEVEAALTGSD